MSYNVSLNSDVESVSQLAAKDDEIIILKVQLEIAKNNKQNDTVMYKAVSFCLF